MGLLKIGKKDKRIVSVDIGSTYLKMVLLSKKKDKVIIDNFFIKKIPDNIYKDGVIEDINDIVESIEEGIKHLKCQKEDCIVSINSNLMIEKKIEVLTNYVGMELDDQVHIEAEEFVPYYNETEVNIDYIDLGVNKNNGNLKDILVIAVKKMLVENIIEVVESAGLNCAIVDIECFAYARYLNRKITQGEEHLNNEINAIVDIGSGSISLNVYEGDNFYTMKDQRYSTDIFNLIKNYISEDENIPLETINFNKIYDFLQNKDIWGEVIEERIENESNLISHNVSRLISYYDTHFPNKKIKNLFITGGLSLIPDILNNIQHKVDAIDNIDMMNINGFNVTLSNKIDNDYFERLTPILSKAINLSLRILDEEESV